VAKHVLITGFEPFGGDRVNPSELVARSLEGRLIAGRPVAVRIMPVETRTLRDRMERALLEEQPDIVIGLGQAGGRCAVALERVAVNVLDFEHPDNVGVMRKSEPIVRGGPEARISNLPFERIVEAWHGSGVPGYVSNSAGTFICNQWLYDALALTEGTSPPIAAGFMHVPALPAQAAELGAERTPSMALDVMRKGVESAIEALALRERGGPEPAARRFTEKLWIPPPRTTRT